MLWETSNPLGVDTSHAPLRPAGERNTSCILPWLQFREVPMKAAVVTENGVQYTDAPKPSPKPHEILIKVRAASLNRADLAVASGHRHGTIGGTGTIVASTICPPRAM